jgi:hypothetical protein
MGAGGGITQQYVPPQQTRVATYAEQNYLTALQQRDQLLLYSRGFGHAAATSASYAMAMRNEWPTTANYKRSIHTRWEDRMLRIEKKRWTRRRMVLGEVAWRIGIVWGGVAIICFSGYMLRWLLVVILG